MAGTCTIRRKGGKVASNIIEILRVQTPQAFTISPNVNEVSIPVPGAGTKIVEDVAINTHFQRLDSPLILEAGIMFPFQFGPAGETFTLILEWVSDDGVTVQTAARFFYPPGVCSVSFAGGSNPGLYLPHPGISDPTWTGRARLSLRILVGSVSMVYAPPQLAGDLNVIPWLRVQHSLALN